MYLKIEAEKVQKNLIERLFVSSYIFRFSFFFIAIVSNKFTKVSYFLFFFNFCLFISDVSTDSCGKSSFKFVKLIYKGK